MRATGLASVIIVLAVVLGCGTRQDKQSALRGPLIGPDGAPEGRIGEFLSSLRIPSDPHRLPQVRYDAGSVPSDSYLKLYARHFGEPSRTQFDFWDQRMAVGILRDSMKGWALECVTLNWGADRSLDACYRRNKTHVSIQWWNQETPDEARKKVREFAESGVLYKYGGPVKKSNAKVDRSGTRCEFTEKWLGGLAGDVLIPPWRAKYIVQAVDRFVFCCQLKENDRSAEDFVNDFLKMAANDLTIRPSAMEQ